MRYVFIVLAFCFAFPLIGQETPRLPFNQKSYPRFYSNDSLFIISKSHLTLKAKVALNGKQSMSVVKKKRWNMPIVKPESNSSTPVFPIDSTQTYFLKVYPHLKG